MLRFSRFRFKEGREADGRSILERHLASLRRAEGCESAWLGEGRHPSTEFVVVALFRDQPSLQSFESSVRLDPSVGGDLFSLMRLTTQPPELTTYEIR